MVRDKKALVILLLLLSWLLINHGLKRYELSNNFNYRLIEAKVNARNKTYDLLILGGSNAIWGLDSSIIAAGKKHYNLALGKEGLSFHNYLNWLESLNVKSEKLVYSSIDIYALSDKSQINEEDKDIYGFNRNFLESKFLSAEPLYKRIKKFIKKRNSLPESSFLTTDQFGNAGNIVCTSNVTMGVLINGDYSYAKGKEFIQRIHALKKALNAKNIFVRIPPIAINKDDFNKYDKFITAFKSHLEANNIQTFSHPVTFYGETSGFCDLNHHPNRNFREKLSNELGEFIRRAAW